jgi:spoIIIJ-associated protein
MEWVETTGRTIEEAKEAALDELGVDEVDAEFEVLAEAQTGLFGRLRAEARVRARVMPTAPRAKEDRRDRRRRNTQAAKNAKETGDDTPSTDTAPETQAPARTRTSSRAAAAAPTAEVVTTSDPDEAVDATGNGNAPTGRARSGGGGRNRPGRSGSRNGDTGEDLPYQSKGAQVEVALEEQAAIAVEFLTELTAEFGLSATVTVVNPDEDTAELQLTGSDLGLLIGPKGATLVAVQNLVRTAVFHATGATNGHINVDVGGYRHKRNEALVRFANQVAAQVKESGKRAALEPMSAVDRKIVHDTIGQIDGVVTSSEGEEPRRRVVVIPDTSAG